MSMEKETFISGYCRGIDDSRMVLVVTADGELLEIDCNYGACPHCSSCDIAKKVQELLKA